MLKSTSLCSTLNQVAARYNEEPAAIGSLTIALISETGRLIASSEVREQFQDSVEQISAILSSISNEYRAVERIEGQEYTSIITVTDERASLCSVLARVSETTNISVVLSIRRNHKSNLQEALGLLRTVEKRLREDLTPPLKPVLVGTVCS
jgi:hypothetical protein